MESHRHIVLDQVPGVAGLLKGEQLWRDRKASGVRPGAVGERAHCWRAEGGA